MSKESQKVLVTPLIEAEKPLINFNGSNYALVSHEELDNLIGSFMQVFDLNGDAVQRESLKAMTKEKCRTWLNNQYYKAGRDEWGYARYETAPAPVHLEQNPDGEFVEFSRVEAK